jgi:hypothetical protein
MMLEHSPLGASGAERYLNCPGSYLLLEALKLPPSDEEDYQREGTAMHEATAQCLAGKLDAWEMAGATFAGITLDTDMVAAINTSLDHAAPIMADAEKVYIEHKVYEPDVHPLFMGTMDFGALIADRGYLRDWKYGAGIAVEVEDNPQFMYYGYGLMKWHPHITTLDIGVVQPRAFHVDGPVRLWSVSADYVEEWVQDTLVPGMLKAQRSKELCAGPWCRFCPAKLVCPILSGLFEVACTYDPNMVRDLSDGALGQSYALIKAVDKYTAAVEKEVFRRLNSGTDVIGTKLVYKSAHRVWKDGAEKIVKAKLGDAVVVPASIKSPAQVEAISPAAKALVSQHAYKPQGNGLTIALAADKRPAVKVQRPSEVFADAVKNLG